MAARREEFVSHPDKFYYELVDTIRSNNRNIFEVGFSDKDRSKHGAIFIEDTTFVITSVNFYYESDFPFSYLAPLGNGRTYLKYEANYYRGHDGKWRLQRTSYATAFKRKSGLLHLVSDYATTEIKPATAIPYIDRIQIGDIFLFKTGINNKDFWAEYNTVLPDDNIEYLFKKQNDSIQLGESYPAYSPGSGAKYDIILTDDSTAHLVRKKNKPILIQDKPSKNTKRAIYDLRSKMKSGIAFTVQKVQIRDFGFSYNNPELEIQHTESSSDQLVWGLSSYSFYEFKPNTFIGLITEIPITITGITSYDLSISKDFNLNPDGRPILISPVLRLGHQQLDLLIDNYTTTEEYKVNGKSFDSGSTDIFLTQRQFHIQPSLMVSVEKSNRLNFFASINYNLGFYRRTGLTFVEKNEFLLFRKIRFLKDGHEAMTIKGNSNDLLNLVINFNAGIFLTI